MSLSSVLLQQVREALGRVPQTRTVLYDKGATVATYLACSLCGHYSLSTLSSEMLLFALAQDDDVAEALDLDEISAMELERAAVSTIERGAPADGWTVRAKGALQSAWASAALRTAPVSRGDLLSGLAGVSGLPNRLLRRTRFDYERFRIEEVVDLSQLSRAVAAAKDDPTWVVSMDDSKTPMPFVTNLLRERFGLTEARAQHLMHTTRFRGAARVAILPYAEAKTRVAAAHEAARRSEHPFELRIVRPPTS